MARNLIAWILIAVGLAAIASGGVMVYIASVVNEIEAENAKAHARRDPNAPTVSRSPRSEFLKQYGSAGISILVGLILTWVGVHLRVVKERRKSGARPPRPKNASKRNCAACGGLSPVTAANCYQCGQALDNTVQ